MILVRILALATLCMIIGIENNIYVSGVETTVDADCIIDKSLPAEGENLQICPEEGDNTKCCLVSGEAGCCPADEAGEDMNLIYTILGSITGVLIVLVICWKFCNSKSCPCLKKIKKKTFECCPCLDKERKKPLEMPREMQGNEFGDEDLFGNPAVLYTVDEDSEQRALREDMEMIAGKPPVNMDGTHLDAAPSEPVTEMPEPDHTFFAMDDEESKPTELPPTAMSEANTPAGSRPTSSQSLNGRPNSSQGQQDQRPVSSQSKKSLEKY